MGLQGMMAMGLLKLNERNAVAAAARHNDIAVCGGHHVADNAST